MKTYSNPSTVSATCTYIHIYLGICIDSCVCFEIRSTRFDPIRNEPNKRNWLCMLYYGSQTSMGTQKLPSPSQCLLSRSIHFLHPFNPTSDLPETMHEGPNRLPTSVCEACSGRFKRARHFTNG